MRRVPVITGLGLVTPLGCGVEQTWSALLDGKYICEHSHARIEVLPKHTRIDALAVFAAREAISQARWEQNQPCALIVGTSKGPIVDWITPPPHTSLSPCIVGGPSNAFGLACTAARLASELNLGPGPLLTLSAACASGLHALIRGVMLIQSGEAERVLVVAAEASLHPLFISSFQRLGVLPREGIGCRPFDEERDGFLIGEAAAAVCLEVAERSGFASIDRFALGSDATHLTGSDPTGEALQHLLRQIAGNQQVDLFHAHATGTTFHDPIELAAIESTCTSGDAQPIIYSHKGALGHSLGAAGLVAVVLNCLMHSRGIVPPNVRTTRPLPSVHTRIPQESCALNINRSIVIAAGFGGAMAAVSLVR